MKANARNTPYLLYAAIIAGLVLLAYSSVISAGFISWDDADFTINNNDVKSFNFRSFFSNFYLGNYAPLTMVSFSIDYMFGEASAWMYHLHNILLHALIAFLVFILFEKICGNVRIALVVALIFALHPLQTESVSWISERKNLICGLFYILSLITYVRYVREQTTRNYAVVLLLFLCALFGKGMAVSLPFSLFAIDLWLKRPFSKKAFTEKIPFFLIAAIFGLAAIKAQAYSGFLKAGPGFSFVQKILFSGYAFMQYVFKMLMPVGLSAVYPYPKAEFSPWFIIGVLVFAACIFLTWYTIKNKKNAAAGGLVFFTGNIIFVLQLIRSGAVLIADHYVYIASLGLIFPIVLFIFSRAPHAKLPVIICGGWLVMLGAATYARNSVWKNNVVFWEDIVKKYPNSEIALSSLGAEYMLHGDDSKAFDYLNKAISVNPSYLKAYYNRGLLFARNNRYENAIADFTKATEQKNYIKAYLSRAEVFYKMKDFSKAINDIQFVLNYDRNNIKANYLAGNCYNELNQLNLAFDFYSRCIAADPADFMFYFNRAIVLGKQQRFNDCLNDLTKCTTINPGFADAYYWKGVAKVSMKQSPCADLQKAMQLGYTAASGPFAKYCR